MFNVNVVKSRAMNDMDYLEIVKDIINHDEVLKMKNFMQHGNTSCYDHCINVSYTGYLIAKKFSFDAKSIARAGLLHDMFLYDWREYKASDNSIMNSHAIAHGKVALVNAKKYFTLTKKEEEMIKKHMWPATIIPPRYLMTYFIGLVDKGCAVFEFLEGSKRENGDICTDP